MGDNIKLFAADGCGPCEQVMELVKQGKFRTNIEGKAELDFVDITTAEGFEEVSKEGLTHVPSAKYKGKTCEIFLDRENQEVVIQCEVSTAPPEEPKV